jgi:putative peptidoglycan lipid II flippase
MSMVLAAAAWGIDWVELGSQRLLRVGLLAGCLAAAALTYFAALRLMGIRLGDFARRG